MFWMEPRAWGRGIAGAALLAGSMLPLTVAGTAAAQGKKTATFDMTIVNAGPGGQVAVKVKTWVTPTQARADVTDPLQGSSRFLVSNGSVYQLNPDVKRGLKSPLPAEFKKSKDNFGALLAMFAFDASQAIKMSKKVRTERMAGYTCDVYSNTVSQGPASRTITVWLPQKVDPKIPVKAVMSDKIRKEGVDVNQTVTITLSNLKVNTPISPSVFKVPTGYDIKTVSAPPAKKK